MKDSVRRPAGLRRRELAVLAGAALLGPQAPAWAQQQPYPSRPVTVIVPFPPGGSTDHSTRVIAERLAQMLGQPFVVHNRPGAAGNIGMAQLAKAEPDGYTLSHGYLGTIAIHPILEGAKLPYNPDRDFTPVAGVASVPLFLVVPPTLGVRSVADLVALAKSKPGQLTYGTAGNGSAQHVFAEAFRRVAGIDIRPIPFAGSGPANVALLGSHIDLMFDAGQVVQQVRSGQLVGLGMTGAKRLPTAPDLPALAETYPGFEAVSWHGLFAPAGTPRPVVELLNARIREILAEPETQRRLAQSQMTPMPMTTAQFGDFIQAEGRRWASVIKSSGGITQ